MLVVLDDPSMDLSTPNGRMIAGIKATQATNYRLDVKRKARDARESFRKQHRWAGGHWPYGYRAEPKDGGGWCLERDSETADFVSEAIKRVLRGHGTGKIAKDWNARGVPTARQHQAATKMIAPGEVRPEPKKYRWTGKTLTRILQDPAILGYATYNGEILREDGLPVVWADPITDVPTFKKVQEIINKRSRRQLGVKNNRSPLVGVIFCECGCVMHFRKNKKYEYYRCSSERYTPCADKILSWPLPWIKDALDDYFDMDLRGVEIQTRRFVPGTDHSDEIATLTDAITHLTGNLSNLPAGSRAAKAVMDQLANHETTLDELEAQPAATSTWEYRGTGTTFDEHWHSIEDWHQRGAWLLHAGFRMVIGGTKMNPRIQYDPPPDVRERLQQSNEINHP